MEWRGDWKSGGWNARRRTQRSVAEGAEGAATISGPNTLRNERTRHLTWRFQSKSPVWMGKPLFRRGWVWKTPRFVQKNKFSVAMIAESGQLPVWNPNFL